MLLIGVCGFLYGNGSTFSGRDFISLSGGRGGVGDDTKAWSGEMTSTSQEAVVTTKEATLTVYICGQVYRPGVYDLPVSARLWDAVELAGGMTPQAAESAINLAEPLSDGERYYIPMRAETEEGVLFADQKDTRININTASKEELTSLPGIGATRAENIVAYREANGKFTSIEELSKVSGISEGILSQISDKIRVK